MDPDTPTRPRCAACGGVLQFERASTDRDRPATADGAVAAADTAGEVAWCAADPAHCDQAQRAVLVGGPAPV